MFSEDEVLQDKGEDRKKGWKRRKRRKRRTRKGGQEEKEEVNMNRIWRLAECKMHSGLGNKTKKSENHRESTELQRRLHRGWPLPYLLLLRDSKAREISQRDSVRTVTAPDFQDT